MHLDMIERFAGLMLCNSLAGWRECFFCLADELGYENTLLAILPDRNTPPEPQYAFLHSSFSSDGCNRYALERFGYIDPVLAHCLEKWTPLVWSSDIFVTREQKAMYEKACAYGLASGIALPMHGAQGERGMLCFAAGQKTDASFQREVFAALPQLCCFRDAVLETAVRFMRHETVSQESISLTPRELECLKWCAVGKKTCDIAQIFGCSESAVAFHLRNLRRKLGVKSSQQAVIKAIHLRLIHP